ncbi:protein FAM92A-like [Actinia tenebrosa]|uniref:Protein FAM92A-like n=1 Tax=Actinia tenebrosa TaxID=6105 RepID=A0A6P8H7T8_ACTTE|nr:protein FAM92A-like [Actinia tenebrosa]
MLRRLSLSHSLQDEEVVRYKNQLELVENHYEEVAKFFEKYAKTTEKMGRKGNNLANTILTSFEDLEQQNIVIQATKFTNCLTSVQRDREELASELRERIASDFRVYETKRSETKKEVRDYNHLLVKEHNEKADLLRLQGKYPTNTRKIIETKVRLEKAEIMTRNARNLLHQQMEDFEKQKLNDCGRILREFVTLEMQFHARVLQTYTKAHQHLMKIHDSQSDTGQHDYISELKNDRDSNSTLNGVTPFKSKGKDSKLSLSDLF